MLKLLSSLSEGAITNQQLALKLSINTDLIQSKIEHCINVGYIKEQLNDTKKQVQSKFSPRRGLLSLSCRFCAFSSNCSSSESDNKIFILTSKGKRAISHLSTIRQREVSEKTICHYP